MSTMVENIYPPQQWASLPGRPDAFSDEVWENFVWWVTVSDLPVKGGVDEQASALQDDVDTGPNLHTVCWPREAWTTTGEGKAFLGNAMRLAQAYRLGRLHEWQVGDQLVWTASDSCGIGTDQTGEAQPGWVGTVVTAVGTSLYVRFPQTGDATWLVLTHQAAPVATELPPKLGEVVRFVNRFVNDDGHPTVFRHGCLLRIMKRYDDWVRVDAIDNDQRYSDTGNWWTMQDLESRYGLVSSLAAEEPESVDVVALQVRVVELEAQVKQAEERLAEVRIHHWNDIQVIGERLIREARDRGWCDEYDTVVDEINRDLHKTLPLREEEYRVTWAETYTVTVERSTTVTARNAEDAVAAVQENGDVGDIPASRFDVSPDWGSLVDVTYEDSDDFEAEES